MIIILLNKQHSPYLINIVTHWKVYLTPGSVEVKFNSPNPIFAGFQINTKFIYIPSTSYKFYDKTYISYALWKEIFAHHDLS